MTTVNYVAFDKQYLDEKEQLQIIFERTFSSGNFVGADVVGQFESEIAEFCGCRFAVALNSGTDALMISLRALGVGAGDEVLVPPNSFIASAGAVIGVGAVPVFVDVGDGINIDCSKIESKITAKTKVIMPVHLSGRIADMSEVNRIAQMHDLKVIEDAAQSVGSRYHGIKSGALGDVGCFSAHPLKNLNAAGDCGFLTTNNQELYEYAKLYGNHGLINRSEAKIWGVVSRMDALQAEILRFRLKKLPDVCERRRQNASLYRKLLHSVPEIELPKEKEGEYNTYHTFIIQASRRNDLQAFLKERNIHTAIHYPIPIHLQPAAAELGYKKGDYPVCEEQSEKILSLPIHQYLSEQEIQTVCDAIKDFYS